MINNGFVSLEVAKLLKEKGFDEPCECFYISCDSSETLLREYFQNDGNWNEVDNGKVSAPSLYQVNRWLMNTRNMFVDVFREECGWGYMLVKADKGKEIDGVSGYKDYEEALLAGIHNALKLI